MTKQPAAAAALVPSGLRRRTPPRLQCQCGIADCLAGVREEDQGFVHVTHLNTKKIAAKSKHRNARERRSGVRMKARMAAHWKVLPSKAEPSARRRIGVHHLHPFARSAWLSHLRSSKKRRFFQNFTLERAGVEARVSASERQQFYELVEGEDVYFPKLNYPPPVLQHRTNTPITRSRKSTSHSCGTGKRRRQNEHAVADAVTDAARNFVATATPEAIERVLASPDPIGVVAGDARDTQSLIADLRCQLRQQQKKLSQQNEELERCREQIERQQCALTKEEKHVMKLQRTLRQTELVPNRPFFTKDFHEAGEVNTVKRWFGLVDDFDELVHYVCAFHPDLKVSHSKNNRAAPLTALEQCLLAKT